MDWFGICAPQKEGGGACCPGMCDPGRQVLLRLACVVILVRLMLLRDRTPTDCVRNRVCAKQEMAFSDQEVMSTPDQSTKQSAAKREPRAGIGIIVALSPDNRYLLQNIADLLPLIPQTTWRQGECVSGQHVEVCTRLTSGPATLHLSLQTPQPVRAHSVSRGDSARHTAIWRRVAQS